MLTLHGNSVREVVAFLHHYGVTVPTQATSSLQHLAGRSRLAANVVLSLRVKAADTAAAVAAAPFAAVATVAADAAASDGAGAGVAVAAAAALAAGHEFVETAEAVVDQFAGDLAQGMIRHLDEVIKIADKPQENVTYANVIQRLVEDAVFNDATVAAEFSLQILTCINHSICMLDNGPQLVAFVREEVAIRALLKLCARFDWHSSLTARMCQRLTSASEAGLLMEPLLAVESFMRVLNPECSVEVSRVALGDFAGVFKAWPRFTHPLRCKVFHLRRSGLCMQRKTLPDFLLAAARQRLDVEQGPLFCLPPPVWLKDADDQWLLCLVQSKRWAEPMSPADLDGAFNSTDWRNWKRTPVEGNTGCVAHLCVARSRLISVACASWLRPVVCHRTLCGCFSQAQAGPQE